MSRRVFFAGPSPNHSNTVHNTPADVMVVDEHDRQPIGRPWLTLALDVASRAVVGILVSLDAPSLVSVAMVLTHAVLPKANWLADRELEVPWPMAGIPDLLHLDNAPEFDSELLRRGAQEYGMEIEHRPIGKPHFGGHIERLIGTMMGAVHLLPGTTFSIFYQGDEAFSGLLEFAEKYHVTSAHFTAIGALNGATLGWFDPQRKMYKKIPIEGQQEVIGMSGDIALYQGKPVVHTHMVVGSADGTTHAGHVLAAYASPTLEVMVTVDPVTMQKRFDPATDLTLIDPSLK